MTKNQVGGLLLVALQCACSADRPSYSSDINALSEQTSLIRAALFNAAVPTADQSASLQSLESRNAFIHSQVPAESWHFLAVTGNGQNSRLAHSTRISRLRVRDDPKARPVSLWEFNDVFMLESELVDINTGKSETRQQIERAALGLSGTDSEAQKVWIGSTSLAKFPNFDDTVLQGSTDNGSSENGSTKNECAARYTLDLPIVKNSPIKIDAVQLNCRDASVLRSAVQSSSNSMHATFTIDSTNAKRAGRAWLVQSWGWPVNNDNAAVVFDRAWLVLNDEYEIQLQQTKRRSGKGPSTTTGKIWPIDASGLTESAEDLMVTWTTNYSGSVISWHISAANPRIDIVVERVVETSLSPDARWFGPIKFSGTHQGLGFMDYQPL